MLFVRALRRARSTLPAFLALAALPVACCPGASSRDGGSATTGASSSASASGGASGGSGSSSGGSGAADAGDPCRVTSITPAGPGNGSFPSPDGTQFVVSQQDDAGVYQIYVAPTGSDALTCISCSQTPGSPAPGTHKFMPVWSPDGAWLMIGAETPNPTWAAGLTLVCNETCLEGLLESGINLDMYAVKPDGSQWTLVVPDPAQPALNPPYAGSSRGYTGPLFSPDGKHAYWSRVLCGCYPDTFGQWALLRSDFVVDGGVPSLQATVDVTPPGAKWVETGDFAPDGVTMLLSTDIGLDAGAAWGQDQWTYDVATGALVNLTHSPQIWDEHGLFSPSGKKIVWMSSLPYPQNSTEFTLKTEFFLMDADGSNVVQLTHFNAPGYPESTSQGSVAAVAVWTADGAQLRATQLVGTSTQFRWNIDFAGRCGGD